MSKVRPKQFFMRPLESNDISTVTQWFVDLDDLALFDRSMRIPLNRERAEKSWSESIGNDGSNGKYWFVVVCDKDKPVGIVGLESISIVNADAVIPMCIERTARNKGVGIRSLALMLDVAFQQLGLNRLTSYYRADNEVSRYLTERVGFRQEGCMRQAWFAGGQHLDMIVIGLLRQEWMERRKTLGEELDPNTLVTFGRGTSGRWTWPPRDAGIDVQEDAGLGG